MADNFSITGGKVTTREVTYSGETAALQVVGLATAAGPDDAKTVTDVSDANPMPVADTNSGNLLLRILQMLMAPLGYDKSLGRHRGTVVVETGSIGNLTTVGTVGTVNTVANIAAIGGYQGQLQIMDTNRAAWALSVRSRIT
jgi:hypothetical protein